MNILRVSLVLLPSLLMSSQELSRTAHHPTNQLFNIRTKSFRLLVWLTSTSPLFTASSWQGSSATTSPGPIRRRMGKDLSHLSSHPTRSKVRYFHGSNSDSFALLIADKSTRPWPPPLLHSLSLHVVADPLLEGGETVLSGLGVADVTELLLQP